MLSRDKKQMDGEYYLGLDVGTDSVGWCATDTNCQVLSRQGKATWGVHLFDAGKSAAERRLFRCSRRRNQRRRGRLRLLEELLNREIVKVDPLFFMRMRESFFLKEDKNAELRSRFSLFADKTYTDVDYHHEFPTIYHLRKALMDHKEKHDVRLYYLAIQHLMKRRGHFLIDGDLSEARDFNAIFQEFREYASEEMELEFEPNSVDAVRELLTNKKLGKTEKKKQIKALFNVSKGDEDEKQKEEALAALCGSKVELAKLFGDDELKDASINKFSFADGVEEADVETLIATLGERFDYFLKLKAIYDWTVLEELLGGKDSISEAQIARYEKHRNDLKKLKSLFRCYLKDEYATFFSERDKEGKEAQKTSYASYVGRGSAKRTELHEFCDEVRKKLNNAKNNLADAEKEDAEKDKDLAYVLSELENYTFLPKQVSKANSSIPRQLHSQELKKILAALGEDYPDLTEKDADGLSVCEKIQKLFDFRIPYYVGPLNTSHSDKGGASWAIRKESGRVLPWNFERTIDCGKSAEKFIERLTNKCSYLLGEDVLPKDSLLYSKYMLLNELNNTRVDGERLSVGLKQKIYEEFFKSRNGKQSLNNLKKWLVKEGDIPHDAELSGVDGTYQATLKSYRDFKRIVGELTDTEPIMVETIIRDILIFGDEREMLRERIVSQFSDKLSDEQIEKILKLRYSGWGRFSRKLLNGIVDGKSGDERTVIQAMWEGSENLQELLSSEHGFSAEIKAFNDEASVAKKPLSYATVSESYASPAVKRAVWRTILIVQEISKIMGKAPSRIFLEVAREKEKNPARKASRKSRLLELYKAIKGEERDWVAELEKTEDQQFNDKRLYLYYAQMGRDIYTDKPLDIREVLKKRANGASNSLYDVDHILPKSLKKDDSLHDNLVLTCKSNNGEKTNRYPLREEFRQKALWKKLLDHGLMTEEKYKRLTRATPLSEEELAGFINRQLTETRQSTKVVADILRTAFPESTVVFSKANLVSDFRQENKFYKSRSVNDYHHAKDAYLNIVVGNVYHEKFTNNPLNFVRSPEGANYNMSCVFKSKVKRGDKLLWIPGDDGTIKGIREQMKRNNILFTRMPLEKRGGFWDMNPLKKKGTLRTLKGAEPRFASAKYGGFDNVGINNFMLVESEGKKGRRTRSLEGLPVYLRRESTSRIREYLEDELGLVKPSIVIPKLRINSLLKIDGVPMHISGKTGERISMKSAVPLVVSPEEERVIQRIDKLLEEKKESGRKEPLDRDHYEKGIRDTDLLTSLYDTLIEKAQKPIYRKRLGAQKEKLSDGREKFVKLGFEEKCRLLLEILKLFQCRNVTADLTLIGGAKNAGVLSIGKKLPDKSDKDELGKNKSVRLIRQSITGLSEREVDLLREEA